MLVKGESCTDRLHSPQHLQSFMGELSRLELLTMMHGQASSRTFLIQRGPDQMDPDPKNRVLNVIHTKLKSPISVNSNLLQMMLMRIFPWMLLTVTNSLVLWTVIAGLLGWYLSPHHLIAIITFFIQSCPN